MHIDDQFVEGTPRQFKEINTMGRRCASIWQEDVPQFGT
jgi:hypothetical protein